MVSITADVELHIKSNTQWTKLPPSVKASLGNASGLYDKAISDFSVKNQLRWRSNIVRHVVKDERKYYENLLQYSQEHLMLYPYHLQDMLIKGLRVTPFSYYSIMMSSIMHEEKSYDSLPNFTAADCLRLMGIGRNQYIDLMNQYRAKKFFRRRGIRDLLPTHPVTITRVEPWWEVNVGFVTEDDIKLCTHAEHQAVDKIIDNGKLEAGVINREAILKLYNRGLIYLDIPIANSDYIVVPPLQGFVMNRVQGDYFETLLYKIFVSIDEHTNMLDLATVLQVDLCQVKDAVSVFIRLAFAYKKSVVSSPHYHESWSDLPATPTSLTLPTGPSPLTINNVEMVAVGNYSHSSKSPSSPVKEQGSVLSVASSSSGVYQRRLGFLFDSTLTAFLMMGNLSPGLKNHAVTMFEVGKLADESMDSFIVELGKVMEQAEGEAKRYYEHAITLRNTLVFLRNNPSLFEEELGGCGLGVDLLRLESMASLDTATLGRVMQKNYSILVSMAPLSQEVQSVSSCVPPHMGPPLPEMNSIWFKLWLYCKLESGPPSLLLAKGNRLRKLPEFIKKYTRVLVTAWGHDSTSVFVSNLLLTVNDALNHSSVLIQAHGKEEIGEEQSVTFPFDWSETIPEDLIKHPCIRRINEEVNLSHTCGYFTFLKTGASLDSQNKKHKRQRRAGNQPGSSIKSNHPPQLDSEKQSRISEFLQDMQKLGIGDPTPSPRDPAPTSQDSTLPSTAQQNGVDPLPNNNNNTGSDSVPSNAGSSSAGKNGTETAGDGMSAQERKLMSEWVPLSLNFGIPLFNEEANKVVCDKIVRNKLMSPVSLSKQTNSNRLLVLDVLNFINKNQDVPYFPEPLDGTHFSDSTSSPISVPMPTRNLLFMGGTLTNFDP